MAETDLNIILRLQDKISKDIDAIKNKLTKGSKEIEDGYSGVTKASDKSNKTVIEGFKEQTSGVNSFLRIFTRVGFIWGLTAGLIIKNAQDISKEIKALDILSIKLGQSTEELSTKFYGFNVATNISRIGVNMLDGSMDALSKGTKRTGNFFTETMGGMAIQWRARMLQFMAGGETPFMLQPEFLNKATSQLEGESAAKNKNRLASSPEAKELMVAEADMYRQLTMSKIEYANYSANQQLEIMRKYGLDTTALQEELSVRQSQDTEMELMRLAAIRLNAQGDETGAMGMEFDRQLMEYKRVWGENGMAVQEYIKTQKVLQDKKATQIWLKNTSLMVGALGNLESAMEQAGATNKGMAKAAAAVSLVTAIINTAQGITAALAGPPTGPDWPLNIAMASMVAATGAIQVATIASQKFAVGTGNVPYDMPASVHRGEIIIPTTFADSIRSGMLSLSGAGAGSGRGVINNIEVTINYPTIRNDTDIDKLTEAVSKRIAEESERL